VNNIEIIDELNRSISKTIVLEHALIGIREGSTEQAADALAICAGEIVNELEKLKKQKSIKA